MLRRKKEREENHKNNNDQEKWATPSSTGVGSSKQMEHLA